MPLVVKRPMGSIKRDTTQLPLSLALTHCLTMASDSLPFYGYGVASISLYSMRALLRHFQDYSGTPKPCETATLIVLWSMFHGKPTATIPLMVESQIEHR